MFKIYISKLNCLLNLLLQYDDPFWTYFWFILLIIVFIILIITRIILPRKKRKVALSGLQEAEKKVKSVDFIKLQMKEIDVWESAIKSRDFSKIIQYYKENYNKLFAYLKKKETGIFLPRNEINSYKGLLQMVEKRKKLANHLYKGSVTLKKEYFESALKIIMPPSHWSKRSFGTFHNCLLHMRGNIEIKNEISKKVQNYLDECIYAIEAFEYYEMYKQQFYAKIQAEQYNSAFNYYLKAESEKWKIKNKNIFLDEKEEQDFKSAFKIVIFNLTAKIKKKVLDLGTKFTRLEMREISEKCNIDNEDLIIKVVEDMIKNEEIYAEYFESTKAVAFNQQANMEEIDSLMATFKEWEEEKFEKK